jgi:hypothetical protein
VPCRRFVCGNCAEPYYAGRGIKAAFTYCVKILNLGRA